MGSPSSGLRRHRAGSYILWVARVRLPAVAGTFYPRGERELARVVGKYLDGARTRELSSEAGLPAGPQAEAPKALIVPHAGYVYSGPVAACAYLRLEPGRQSIGRVVIIGPAHRVALSGLALPEAELFSTPLGKVAVDRDAVRGLLELAQVRVSEQAHEFEHSLEVHLPFLQTVLDDFTIVPLVVGQATADEVAEVLERVWGGPETLILISSDLSHYYDYETAGRMDAGATRAIERLDPAGLKEESACGRIAVGGLLLAAGHHGLSCTTLDVRNSGDTAGTREEVVGYGSYLFQ